MRNFNKKYKSILILNFIFIVALLGCVIFLCVVLNINHNQRPSNIFNSTINSVVELRAETDDVGVSYGTAIFVDKKGTLVSNAHLVCYENGDLKSYHQSISIRFHKEDNYHSVNLIDCDIANDLCILSFVNSGDNHDFKPINIINSLNIKEGDIVYTIGNAMNHGLSICQGIVSIPLIEIVMDELSYRVIQCDLTINNGNSGGALIDESGNLIGMTTFRIRDNSGYVIYGVAFAIPSNQIESYINSILN